MEPIEINDAKVDKMFLKIAEIPDFSALVGKAPLLIPKKETQLNLYRPNQKTKGVVLIVPGSEGVRNRMIGQHIRYFLQLSYAVLVVNSYQIRGFDHVLDNQAAVSFPSQVLDLILAIQTIQHRREFQHLPIGLFGTSRGAMAILLALDKRIFHRFHLTTVDWACLLYPAAFLQYDAHSVLPTSVPILEIIAGQDDEVSPKQVEQYTQLLNQHHAQLRSVTWKNAVHLFDAPFPKTWLPNAASALHVPVVTINSSGQFISGETVFNNWTELNAYLNHFTSKGIHIGYTEESRTKIFGFIRHFVNAATRIKNEKHH